MVNTNIQGNVPIQGSGLSLKKFAVYNNGEYYRLHNALIDAEGRLTSRAPVNVMGDNGTVDKVTDVTRILGNWSSYSVICSETVQKALPADQFDTAKTLWAPTSLPVPGTAGSYHNLVSFFQYNQRQYWISVQYDAGAPMATRFSVILHNSTLNYSEPNAGVTYAMLTHTTLFQTEGVVGYFWFNNALIQGDRLWISTSLGVWFSKVTDPSIFAVPDGGFFKFPAEVINWCIAVRDSIYVLCEDSLHVITYSTDPNEDAVVRKIADISAMHGTVYKDTPYFVNAEGVYGINNFGVEKVLSFQNMYSKSGDVLRLEAYDKYIVITYSLGSLHTFVSGNEGLEPNFIQADTYSSTFVFSDEPFNCLFLDMEAGTLSSMDIRDAYNNGLGNKGDVFASLYNPTMGTNSGPYLMLMTGQIVGASYDMRCYAMHAYQDRKVINDTVFNDAGAIVKMLPQVNIHIRGYTPDGNSYMIKKFRSLEIEGYVGENLYKVNIGFDRSRSFPITKDLTYDGDTDFTAGNHWRSSLPFRMGINQRAQAINIQITVKSIEATYAPAPAQQSQVDGLVIEDIRFLWTYIKRAVTKYSPTS